MRKRIPLHALLRAPSDSSGQWSAWCPELDVYTCGDHPDNAAAMLEDAVHIVVSHCLQDWQHTGDHDIKRKRVMHPLRLGDKAHLDEDYGVFKSMESQKFEANHDSFMLNQLSDGLDSTILVDGSLSIETRSGVVKVDVFFQEWGFVPVDVFEVKYKQAFDRRTTVSVRSSVLAHAGDLDAEIIMEEAKQAARDPIGPLEVKKVGS